jgi:hypothetical protein
VNANRFKTRAKKLLEKCPSATLQALQEALNAPDQASTELPNLDVQTRRRELLVGFARSLEPDVQQARLEPWLISYRS